jgi:uncharacterized protein YciW
MTETDIIDRAAGLASGSPVAALRRQRPDFVRHGQGSYDVLIMPADPGGVSLAERAAVALRVASIEQDAVLSAHYRERLQAVGGSEPGETPRLTAILRHVTLITGTPGAATKADLDTLLAAGLQPRDIVAIAQIVAFVSYQVRATTGLRLLDRETRA